ncbi:MAG: CHC2 zinc finger domain-containing protein [Candidatus Acidiferrales bacterium]
MPTLIAEAREIAALVAMPRLLESLGFTVNERTHRNPCLITSHMHSSSNASVFSWRDDGRWHCFSRSEGGDRIALVIAVTKTSFREAVEYLAALAGVEYHRRRVSPREIARRQKQRERAERAAWRISDEVGRLRRYYTGGLHRAERLQARIGDGVLRADAEMARDAAWGRLARLAPVSTFFFASWNFVSDAKPNMLARFALASPAERRQFILEEDGAV